MTKQEVDDKIRRAEFLTQEQFDAVTDDSETVLTLACAGSGKSRTLAYRVARIVATEESPESIVAFTFTESAAEAMKRAIASALATLGLSPTSLGQMYIGTIHSYCEHFLAAGDPGYRQLTVLDDKRLSLFIYSRAQRLGLYDLMNSRVQPSGKHPLLFDTIHEVVRAWQLVHDEMIAIDDVIQVDSVLGGVLRAIEVQLSSAKCIDFSQQVSLAAQAMNARTELCARHLLVDEYQDINPAQEEIIRRMHELGAALFVVGDDDQAIYAWRGADVTMISSFQERHEGSGFHILPTNFRSTAAIVSVSNEFAEKTLNPVRIAKSPRAESDIIPQELGVMWFDSRDHEATWVANRIHDMLGMAYYDDKIGGGSQIRGLTAGDFAILMRSTASGDPPHHAAFSNALEELGVSYSLAAGNKVCSSTKVAAVVEALELLRDGIPDRPTAKRCFDTAIVPEFPSAVFEEFVRVLNEWGTLVHTPPASLGGPRRRVGIQGLLQGLLAALGVNRAPLAYEQMRILGQLSRIIEDVETVYVSIDSESRYQEVLNFLENVAPDAYEMSTDDLVTKPDTVTISTVHGVKGLQFPVVFVVDVDARRFPHDRKPYDVWVPRGVAEDAVRRGAYATMPTDEARLLYTALTRAERFLYVTGSENEAHLTKPRKPGRFFDLLVSSPDTRIVHDSSRASSIDLRAQLQPRTSDSNLPTSFSEIRTYLNCPMQYTFRNRWQFAPPVNEMLGFGTTVHTIIERLHTQYPGVPNPDEVSAMVSGTFYLPHAFPRLASGRDPGPYERAQASADHIVNRYVSDHRGDFERIRRVEASFEIPVLKAVLAGSIDLLMRDSTDGTPIDAELVDFKAMDTEGGSEGSLDWAALSLQVQLYARAARDVLGTPVRLGSVHMLKDGERISIPIDAAAQDAAVMNIEWAVSGILGGALPMRPHPTKCAHCDFHTLCPQRPEDFAVSQIPPQVHVPAQGSIDGLIGVAALIEFDAAHHRVD